MGRRPCGARLRETDGMAGRRAPMALGARRRARHAVSPRPRGLVVKVLLLMDPFIKVPPEQYGGIERVVADLADGLARSGHEVTLWAAPGSHVNGRVVAFGQEGEWTRWSNLRNALTLAGRFLAGRARFDVIHNFGRLAYLAPVLARDVPKIQTYMRTVNPANMTAARRLGARRLRYTAVSAAIRDTGVAGGGGWSVIYNCSSPER